jgi:arylsulfatase A-like enzyme
MTRAANTHAKLASDPVYGSLYRDDRVQLPATFDRDPAEFVPSAVLPQGGRSRTYSYNYAKKTCLEHHVRYYQLIHGIDRVVGDLRTSLARRGLAERTVIIFSSDHGLLLGDYAMGGKALLYDLTARVPFIVFDPALPSGSRGRTVDDFVLSVDVAPTLLAYAGVAVPDSMQGRSLRALIAGVSTSWRTDIFLENLYIGRSNPLIEAIRTPRWKYVRYFQRPGNRYRDTDVDFRGKDPIFEQLFDLAEDPGELLNAIGNTAHAKILERLRERCRAVSDELIAQRAAD